MEDFFQRIKVDFMFKDHTLPPTLLILSINRHILRCATLTHRQLYVCILSSVVRSQMRPIFAIKSSEATTLNRAFHSAVELLRRVLSGRIDPLVCHNVSI